MEYWQQFFIISVFISGSTGASTYKGCYEEQYPNRFFAFPPGNYQPNNLTHQMCLDVCMVHGMPIAALTGGRFCFCSPNLPSNSPVADATCDDPCSGNSAAKCGGLRHASVWENEVDVNGLKLEVPNEGNLVADEQTAVNFTYLTGPATPNMAVSYEPYNQNGGRRSMTFQQKDANVVIMTSGLHVMTAYAFKSDGVTITSTYSEKVMVNAPIGNIIIQCPTYVKAREEFSCNVTVNDGSRMDINVTYGDGQTEDFPIADAIRTLIGPAIYPGDNLAAAASMGGNTIFRRGQSIPRSGYIKGLEYFATTAGTVDMFVLEPACTAGQTYCHGQCTASACSPIPTVTCSGGEVFCQFKEVCVTDPNNVATCPASSPTPHHQYIVKSQTSITLQSPGYKKEISLNIAVNRYDIIAFASTGGVFAKITGSTGTDMTLAGSISQGQTVDLTSSASTETAAVRVLTIDPSIVKIYHNYQTTGVKPLEVRVENRLINSSMVATDNVVVLDAINTTDISKPSQIGKGEMVEFGLLPHTGQPTNKTWFLGDGTVIETTNTTIQHVFTNFGTFNVCVAMVNAIDEGFNCTLVDVVDRITNVQLSSIKTETNQTARMDIQIATGSHVTCTWRIPSETPKVTHYNATPLIGQYLSHVFRSHGVFVINVTCANLISQAGFVYNHTVLDPVKSFDFLMGDFMALGQVNQLMVAIGTSDPVTVTWDIDGATSVTTSQVIGTQSIATYNFTFSTLKSYTVNVTVRNITISKTIQVQSPVDDQFLLSSNSPVHLLTGQPIITLSRLNGLPLPTSASISCHWGDSSANSTIPVGSATVNLAHNFTAGTHNVRCDVFNQVSRMTFTTVVTVAEQLVISGVTVKHLDSASEVDGEGPNKDEHPMGVPVKFYVAFTKGIATMYNYTVRDAAGNIVAYTAPASPISHTFTKADTYTITTTAINAISTDVISTAIKITAGISGIKITDNNIVTKAGQNKTITVNFQSLGFKTCCRVNYSDNEPVQVYGFDGGVCTSDNKPDLGGFVSFTAYKGQLSRTMTFTRRYNKTGSYILSIYCYDSDKPNQIPISKSLPFPVSSKNCKRPDIKIINAVSTILEAPSVTTSDSIRIDGRVTLIDCPSSLQSIRNNMKSWRIWKLPENNAGISQELPELQQSGYLHTEYSLRKESLSPGSYRVAFRVTFDGSSGIQDFYNEVDTFVKVDKSPLVAGVLSGGVASIELGTGQSITLDALEYTRDPDDPLKTKPQACDWYCRKLTGDNALEATLQTSLSNGNQSAALQSMAETLNTNDGSRCYNNKAGQVSTGCSLVVSRLQLKLGIRYLYVVKVSKDDRSDMAMVMVGSVNNAVPLVTFKCPNEFICKHSSGSLLVNSGYDVPLEATCHDGCHINDVIIYNWIIQQQTAPNVWQTLANSDSYISGQGANKISISKTLFTNNSILAAGNLRVKLDVDSKSQTGTATTQMVVNKPPEGGSCNVYPLDGDFMKDNFTMQCSGWTDPEGGKIESFQFFVHAKGEQKDTLIGTDKNGVFQSHLRVGPVELDHSLEVFCIISDSLGASTKTVIGNVKVRPMSLADAETFLANSAKLELAGNIDQVNSQIQALSSVLNIARAASLSGGNITKLAQYGPNYKLAKPKNLTETEYEKGRNDRAKIRADLMASLTLVAPNNLESLTSVAANMDMLTAAPEELGRTMQRNTAIYIRNVASTLKSMIQENDPKGVEDAAVPMIRSMSSIETACALGIDNPVQQDIEEVDRNTMEYDTDPMSLDPNHDDLLTTNLSLAASHLQRDISTAMTKDNCSLIRRASQEVLPDLVTAMATTLTRNEEIRIITPNLNIFVKRNLASNFAGSLKAGRTEVVMPPTEKLLQRSVTDPNQDLLSSMTVSTSNFYMYSKTSNLSLLSHDSKILTLVVLDENSTTIAVKNTSVGVKIMIPNDTPVPHNYMNISAYLEGAIPKDFIYHQILMNPNHGLMVEIYPADGNYNQKYLAILGRGFLPTTKRFAASTIAEEYPPGSNRTLAFWDNSFFGNFNGTAFIGLRPITSSFAQELKTSQYNATLISQINTNAEFSSDYEYRVIPFSCVFWDEDYKEWTTRGVVVLNDSTINYTACLSNHLTSFAGGWIVKPNKIDWSLVFSKADFMSNPTLYITQIIIAILFIMIAVWARRKDLKDREKVGVCPLPDNDPRDKYLYEIIVSTGFSIGAATNSKVYCVINGNQDETDVRALDDDKRKCFRRGNIDLFLLATPRPLGDLQFVRIWHDVSGKGKYQSWFLEYLTIRDVQTGQKWIFQCNKWFALEHDDGMIERSLPVASEEELTEFNSVFTKATRRDMSDGHLWLSVINRPPTSRFTRVQRLSCCLCLMYTMMLTNAMFYEKGEEASSVFTIGPFALSPEQISIGILSNLVVFPVNFLIIYLFRKSRPRKMANRIQVALEEARKKFETNQNEEDGHIGGTAPNEGDGTNGGNFDERKMSKFNDDQMSDNGGMWLEDEKTASGFNDTISPIQPMAAAYSATLDTATIVVNQNESEESKDKIESKRQFSFPWWGNIIAWVLPVVTVGISVAFVTFYGITFQEVKCKKWITSLLVSLITSMLFTQPMKILLFAAFISVVCKKKNTIEDADLVKEEEQLVLGEDQEWLHSPPGMQYPRPQRPKPHPLNTELLERARAQRIKELEMMGIIREIIVYFLFVWILLVVGYSIRDPHAYEIKDHLTKVFITASSQGKMDLEEVNGPATAWEWMRTTLVPGLRANRWYNNQLPIGQRGFLSDRVSRIMGYAVIRQLRNKKESKCVIPYQTKHAIKKCNRGYNLQDQEEGHFDEEWKVPPSNATTFKSQHCKRDRHPYCYHHWRELEGYPYIGKHEVYSGGGYVIPLRGRVSKMTSELEELEKQAWIDDQTRAIFIEFTVYNAFINIFGIVTISMEVLPTGHYDIMYRVEPVNLLQYFTSAMLFQIVCDIAFLCFIVFFMVKQAKELKKEGKKYFKEPWNYIELAVIVLSIFGVAIFVYRLVVARILVRRFNKSHGNAYMKFQYIGYWNEILMYDVGWLCFLATLKFLRILRFNKRMSMLAETLRNSGRQLLSFAFMFTGMFSAFVFAFYFLLGHTLKEYSTVIVCAESMMNMMLGAFDFHQIKTTQPVFGPLLFFLFICVISFIVLNMFISILNDSFADIPQQENDYEIVDFMVERFKKMVGISSSNSPPEGESPPDGDEENDLQYTEGQTDAVELEPYHKRIDEFLNKVSYLYFEKQAMSMTKYDMLSYERKLMYKKMGYRK